MPEQRNTLLQGTLDLLIVRTLVLGPHHGSATSERAHQVSGQSSPGPARVVVSGAPSPRTPRLDQGALGTPENSRRAKYYELTKTGRKQFEAEMREWGKLTCAAAQVSETA
jgi:PadR family transcriptional regulator, regulatory protein PadR